MREPCNFTANVVAGFDLELGESDVWIWDADGAQHSGLGIRMRRGKTGVSKTFYAAYRFGGQDRRDRLGDVVDYKLADARHRVYELRRAAADGIDPRAAKAAVVAQAVKASNCPTFAEYAEHYLRRREKELRPNTYRDRERYLTGPHLEPFKKVRVDQIDRAAIAQRLNFLEDTGITKPSAHVAQAARMALIDLFKLAVAEGLVEANPVKGTRQPMAPRQQKARERTLDGAELAALWNTTGGDDDHDKIVRLAILFGGRRQEIGGMRWSELDLDAGTWTLPAERSKTGSALTLPMPAIAISILQSVERRDGRDQVFGGRSPDGFVMWSGAKRELDGRLPFNGWVLHDLRRTLVTGLHELGVEPHIVKAIVGHSQGADVHARHYNRASYTAQKADALQKWAAHVERLASGVSNVVPLRAA